MTRTLRLVLPLSLAQTMWRRAQQWDTRAGGRFSAHARLILVWSGALGGRQRVTSSEPQAAISVDWGTPDEHQATIAQVAWNPQAGGDEGLAVQALNVLAGQTVIRR